MKAIGEFIKGGGYFPNNLLINFTRPVKFERSAQDDQSGVQFGRLHLPDRYRSAWIIDGQHRLYGFAPVSEHFLAQNIIVVAFENLPKEEEANLFVTINHEQKSVPKHLLDDLEGELKWGSEVPSERIGSISARLITTLNSDIGEPFYNRITQQGMPTTARTSLSIPALKDALRRSALVGRSMLRNSVYDHGPLSGRTDAETLDRARSMLNDFFSVIRNANLGEWESGRDGHVCTNVAVQAFIMLLGSLIKYWEMNTASNAREMEVEEVLMGIDEYIKPIRDFLEGSSAAEIASELHVQFGAGGPPEYYYRLCKIVKAKYSDFQPEGMEDWEAEQSEDRISEADAKLKDIVTEMRNYIFSVLRNVHGEKNNAYWERGVSDKGVKEAAYGKSLDTDVDDRLPLETYLEVVEMKKIVESKENWNLLKPVFNIPEPNEKGLAKNLKWMLRVNELRRIPAHPARERKYKVENFEYIDFIYDEFMRRLRTAQDGPEPEMGAQAGDDDD
jgi:DGQHR domain-containing protein